MTPRLIGATVPLPFWTPPVPVGRLAYPSVMMFLPPATAQTSVMRILQRIAPPLYRLQAYEAAQWMEGRPSQGYRHMDLFRHGGLYHWWTGISMMEAGLQASDCIATDFRYLAILRDPRDSLVSLFHLSTDPKHAPSPEYRARYDAYMAESARIAQMGVDEYVLEVSPGWIGGLLEVMRFLQRMPADACRFLSYAALCEDFPAFLAELVRFLRVEVDPDQYEDLLLTEDVRLKATHFQGSLAHFQKASPLPGRHKRELQPETIAVLNARSAELRQWMRVQEFPALAHLYDD